MSEQTPVSFEKIDRLMEELGFTPADAETAIGELSGIPATFTLLGAEPLSGMFQFRINPDNSHPARIDDLLSPIPDDEISFSIEEKYAWLSLYNLDRLESPQLCNLVREFVSRFQASSYANPDGCLRCGAVTGVTLLLVEGSPTRVCENCLADAAQERHQREGDLNRATLSATIGLPFTGFLVALAWAICWTAIDLLLEFWNVKVIFLDQFSILIMLLAGGGLGYLIGWPTGVAMRRSAAIRAAPFSTIGLFVVATVLGGEILYFALYLVRFAGLFDLGLAARLFAQFVSMYSAFWMTCKLALAAAIYFFCFQSATTRHEVAIDL